MPTLSPLPNPHVVPVSMFPPVVVNLAEQFPGLSLTVLPATIEPSNVTLSASEVKTPAPVPVAAALPAIVTRLSVVVLAGLAVSSSPEADPAVLL